MLDSHARRNLVRNLFHMEEWRLIVDLLDRIDIEAVEGIRAGTNALTHEYALQFVERLRGHFRTLAAEVQLKKDPFESRNANS